MTHVQFGFNQISSASGLGVEWRVSEHNKQWIIDDANSIMLSDWLKFQKSYFQNHNCDGIIIWNPLHDVHAKFFFFIYQKSKMATTAEHIICIGKMNKWFYLETGNLIEPKLYMGHE
jgi:hypothetical protein